MIIWINGAFGSGKTQTAYELQRRIPNSWVYDPENVGYFIHRNIPPALRKSDFQDFAMWREFNYDMLKHLDSECGGVVIVPMTIVKPEYFAQIVGRLRDSGVQVNHFTLWAPEHVILKRLRSRGDGAGSWGAERAAKCIQALADDVFQVHVDTEDIPVEVVAERIASGCNIILRPDERGKLRKALDRITTQIRHIRILQ